MLFQEFWKHRYFLHVCSACRVKWDRLGFRVGSDRVVSDYWACHQNALLRRRPSADSKLTRAEAAAVVGTGLTKREDIRRGRRGMGQALRRATGSVRGGRPDPPPPPVQRSPRPANVDPPHPPAASTDGQDPLGISGAGSRCPSFSASLLSSASLWLTPKEKTILFLSLLFSFWILILLKKIACRSPKNISLEEFAQIWDSLNWHKECLVYAYLMLRCCKGQRARLLVVLSWKFHDPIRACMVG